MNGISVALVERKTTKGATAADVLRRHWLLIDCDPDRPANTSATDAEKAKARALMEAIGKHLKALGWPSPVVADSGNGYHLLYKIDLPADDDAAELVRNVLIALAKQFDTEGCKVDRKVFDAPRLVKLYGTEARKGEATPEAPPVRPRDESSVQPGTRTRRAAQGPGRLGDRRGRGPAGDERPRPRRTSPSCSRRPSCGTRARTPAGRRDRAAKYLESCEPAIDGQGGHNRTFKVAVEVGPGFDLPPDVAYRLLASEYNPCCEPPWSERELRHKVDEAYAKESRRGWHLDDGPKGRNGKHSNGAAKPPSNGRNTATTPPPPTVLQRDGQEGDPELPVNEAPDDPHRIVAVVLDAFKHPDGPTVVSYRDGYFAWDEGAYRPNPDFGNRLTQLIKAEADRQNRAALSAHREQAEVGA